MTKINSLRGMPDLYSDDLISWTSVENNLENIFKSYSLKELRTPILEYTDLFKRSVGDTSDIVNKEIYAFNDRNDQSISLRPEGTAGVIRSISPFIAFLRIMSTVSIRLISFVPSKIRLIRASR